MQYQPLGRCFSASRLVLGGGGIGQVWGATDRDEALATVRLAYESGINCFDLAPLYGKGEAERVVGMVFDGGYPDDVHVTTKCMLGDTPANQVAATLSASLTASCERMGRDFVDAFILHGCVIADGWVDSVRPELLPRIAVPYSRYQEVVVPAFDALKREGRIGAWGITAASTQPENLRALDAAVRPDVVQCIANLLDSPGGMAIVDAATEPPRPREVIERAQQNGLGVMGIRAVAAGALTDQVDRELPAQSAESRDFVRAAGFRELAKQSGESASYLAHLYALSMPGVDVVVLGVKNRAELEDCLRAEAAAPMDAEMIRAIDEAATGL